MNYISPKEEDQKQFYQKYKGQGKITMLNLLKYKEVALYASDNEDSHGQISGKQAYLTYIQAAGKILNEMGGGKLVYFGETGSFLIGPSQEKWDAVILMEYDSVDTFLKFAGSEAYKQISFHRTAALEDSRLLPSTKSH